MFQTSPDIYYGLSHGNGFELLPQRQAVSPIIGTVLSGPVFHLRRCDKLGMLGLGAPAEAVASF